jgi:hypothetical protein
MFDRPLPQRAEFARAHRLFFVAKFHGAVAARRSALAIIARRSRPL